MNVVTFLQILLISYLLQYYLIESTPTLSSTQLWSSYYSIFNHQLENVFKSHLTLYQANSFEHSHHKNPNALSYGCTDYRHGQNLGNLKNITIFFHIYLLNPFILFLFQYSTSI